MFMISDPARTALYTLLVTTGSQIVFEKDTVAVRFADGTLTPLCLPNRWVYNTWEEIYPAVAELLHSTRWERDPGVRL